MPNKYSVLERVPRSSGWKSAQGGGSLPVEETRPSPSGAQADNSLRGRDGGRPPPHSRRGTTSLPRGREVTGKRRARRSAADIPPHGFPGGSPPAAARQLPPPSTHPAARRDPRGRPAPRAALRRRQPTRRRGAQPGPRARRPGAAATERLSPGARFQEARESRRSSRPGAGAQKG